MLNKKEMKQYRAGKLRVYTVDAAVVRNSLDVNFCLGGHGLVYKYVPKDEVWIDDTLTPSEVKFTLYHELVERRNMARGLKYDDAHYNYANRAEGRARHIDDVDRLIRLELDKVKELMVDPSIYNGAVNVQTDGKTQHRFNLERRRRYPPERGIRCANN